MQGRIYVAEDRTSESDQPANEQYNERLRYTCPHTDDAGSINAAPDCDAFRKEFEIDNGDFVIAMIAQFIPRKGHRFLFDVLPNLRDDYPNIRVLLFGSGPQEAELRALAMTMNLYGTLQFAGFREDLDDYLACIDLLVHPDFPCEQVF